LLSVQGHCQHFKSTYREVAESVPDVEFYAVSCVTHHDVCQANNVRSWPSIYTFQKGSNEKTAWKGRGATGFSADAVRAVFGDAEEAPSDSQQHKLPAVERTSSNRAVERNVKGGASDAVNGESNQDDEVSRQSHAVALRYSCRLDVALTTHPRAYSSRKADDAKESPDTVDGKGGGKVRSCNALPLNATKF
jgi:Thioredoxin